MTVIINLRLPMELRETLDRRLRELLRAQKLRMRSAAQHDSPHVNLSNLTRLAIERGLDSILKEDDEAVVDQILTTGLRRGQKRGNNTNEV